MYRYKRKINPSEIETPALFASYRIGDFPRAGLLCHPWKITGTQAVLVNAFDLLANRQTKIAASKIREKQCKLHEFIEFDGPVMLDSGAFNFQKENEISIDPLEVLSIGIKFGVNISVVLDHPFLPKSDHEEKIKRWGNTLDNTRKMFEKLNSLNSSVPNDFQLMPVLHGHDPEALKRSFDDIVKICGQDPPIVGIGSLEPFARNGSKRTAIDIICKVRELLPESHIHCFSMGSVLLMLFAFYCGADTVDSQSWMLSAAFKHVQLPGFSWTRLSPREKEKDPKKYEQIRREFAKHLLKLKTEENFSVKNWGKGYLWTINNEQEALSYLDFLEDKEGKKRENHIHHRACHNLYAFNFEANRVRQEMIKSVSSLEIFIESRMKSTVYRKTFEHAVKKVNTKS